MPRRDRLKEYRRKRDFARTPEPAGQRKRSKSGRSYVIQKHAARRLHYDFRLEHNGALLSWAIPRGPSLDPNDKRLAVRTEDHPLEYGNFEGTIPKGEYGAGTVLIWDRGTWEPHDDPDEGLKKGKLGFELHGKRLTGNWALVRLRPRGGKKERTENWLLIKERDDTASKDGTSLVERQTKSVKSGREMDAIARGRKVWHSRPAGRPKAEEANRDEKAVRRGPKTKPPPFVSPQLATLVDAPPSGSNWLHEIKYDGYRAVTSVADGQVVIRTRNGLDWTDRFRALTAPLAKLPCRTALLDGEIAVADEKGHTDFGALQEALSTGSGGYGYYLFDLLHLDGEDLRRLPLIRRKERLRKLLASLPKGGPLLYSDHVVGHGEQVLAQACGLGLEGIISKLADAPYRSDRTRSWLKIKCGKEQEFVIIGWRPSDKAGRPFASLLLAVRDNGRLRYAGRVGTGYSERLLDELRDKFRRYARESPPVSDVPTAIARRAKFVEPVLVADIAFGGWTRDNLIRQGSFKGLRGDKPASAVVREREMPRSKAVRAVEGNNAEVEGVRITNPERVLYAKEGLTKRALIDHYLAVAERMLPLIEGRPLALVRCPRGNDKDCFFQKHGSAGWPTQFGRIRIREKSGTDEYLYIEDEAGLVAAAQMDVLELHVWGSRADRVEQPDRMVFDLDPDVELPFDEVKAAARELRDRLGDLGLESFPMATGGKGIHVVVPLAGRHSWDDHRNFAEALARTMAHDSPDRYTAVMSKARRRGKIFVDYLRNQRGSTAIAPYSTRGRSGPYFALPLSWKALGTLKDARPVKIGDGPSVLRRADPWKGYRQIQQALPKAAFNR